MQILSFCSALLCFTLFCFALLCSALPWFALPLLCFALLCSALKIRWRMENHCSNAIWARQNKHLQPKSAALNTCNKQCLTYVLSKKHDLINTISSECWRCCFLLLLVNIVWSTCWKCDVFTWFLACSQDGHWTSSQLNDRHRAGTYVFYQQKRLVH